MRILAITVVFLGILFVPQVTRACSCVLAVSGNPPCQSFWNTPVVFSGHVIEIKTIIPDEGPQKGWRSKLVRFAVTGDYRGNVGQSTEVLTGQGGGDCGFEFQVGQDYLVYAGKGDDGMLGTSICTPTKLLEKATEELQFI